MFCFHCGQELPDWAIYCLICGTRQNAEESAVLLAPEAEYFLNDDSFKEWKKQNIHQPSNLKVPDSIEPIDPELSPDAPSPFLKTLNTTLNNLIVGEKLCFGAIGGIPTEWIVLQIKERKALILSKLIICSMRYNMTPAEITWKDCFLRKWLNTTYLNNCFTKAEIKRIVPCKLINNDNAHYQTPGGEPTTDQIFLLSIEEAKTFFANNESRSNGSWWWLRSPGGDSASAAGVLKDGSIIAYGTGVDIIHGVRPAMWINLDS